MSDLHRLPLVPHDLPAYQQDVGTGDWRVTEQRERVRVFKDTLITGYWFARHPCSIPAYERSFGRWELAIQYATHHAKECCK